MKRCDQQIVNAQVSLCLHIDIVQYCLWCIDAKIKNKTFFEKIKRQKCINFSTGRERRYRVKAWYERLSTNCKQNMLCFSVQVDLPALYVTIEVSDQWTKTEVVNFQ